MVKTCANCKRLVGDLEVARPWNEHVVCAECFTRLQAAATPPTPTQSATPLTTQARCPRCASTSISMGTKGFSASHGVAGAMLVGPVGLAAGASRMNDPVVTCISCGHSWDPRPNPPPQGSQFLDMPTGKRLAIWLAAVGVAIAIAIAWFIKIATDHQTYTDPHYTVGEAAAPRARSISRWREHASTAAVTDSLVPIANVSASSTHKQSAGYNFAPANLTDGDLSTSWQPAKPATPASVSLVFRNEIVVTSVSIANGFQAADRFGDEFALNARIAKGRLRFSDDTELAIEFPEDERGFSRFELGDKRTREITILIDTTWRGSKWNDTAVSEVEIRGHDAPH